MLKNYKIKLYLYSVAFISVGVCSFIAHQEMQVNVLPSVVTSVLFIMLIIACFFYTRNYIVSIILWPFILAQYLVTYKNFQTNHFFIKEDAIIMDKMISRMKKTPSSLNINSFLMENQIIEVVTKRITKDSWFTLIEVAKKSLYYNNLPLLVQELHKLKNVKVILKDPEQRKFIRMLIPVCLNCQEYLNNVKEAFPETATEIQEILKESSK